jgi:hypothetical protein
MMEEIASNVYIEVEYPRLTLGVIKLNQGMVIIDTPFWAEDVPKWQSKLRQLGTGMELLLVLMDAHIDRLLTTRAMDATLLAHDNAVEIIRSRSTASKIPELEAYPHQDSQETPIGSRCAKPQLTYSDQVLIHWDEVPLVLSHKQGAHLAGTWLIYDACKVVFIGDSLVVNQPPFFAHADIDAWIKDLNLLGSERFKDYVIVSSRQGVIGQQSIPKMVTFLSRTKILLDDLGQQAESLDDLPAVTSELLSQIDFDPKFKDRYSHRLSWGLEQYITRHFIKQEAQREGEDA